MYTRNLLNKGSFSNQEGTYGLFNNGEVKQLGHHPEKRKVGTLDKF